MLEAYERRRRERTPVDASLDMSLVQVPSGRKIGDVLDISGNGFRVKAGDRDVYSAGDRLSDFELRWSSGSIPVAELEVMRVKQTLDGATLAIEVLDESSRAAAWDLADRLRMGGLVEDRAPGPFREDDRVPARGHYTEEARLERLEWIRKRTGKPLSTLKDARIDPRRLTGNVENFIGSLVVPVGLAGPLLFTGVEAKGEIAAPLATTEGALVASATRGARAVSLCGGVTTMVVHQRMLRVPNFGFGDIRSAARFGRWVRDHALDLRRQVELVSDHAGLIMVEPVQLGRNVHVRFVYETGDAAGQNMTTACTWNACRWIDKQLGMLPDANLEAFQIEGNISGDKKVTYGSFINGRGLRVTADAHIGRDVLRDVLKVTPEAMIRHYIYGTLGGIQVGMVGNNLNVANIVAGIFAATGQDIACVHESSLGIFSLQQVDDGIHVSMDLPALVLGTIGGGTALDSQRDYLDMLGCVGAGKAGRLGEIIAGYALALDLSTLSAIVGGQFAAAHNRLGRNRPVDWFSESELTPAFFNKITDDSVEVIGAVRVDRELGSSIVSELTARSVAKKALGLLPMELDVLDGGCRRTLDVMVKIKPLDAEVIEVGNQVAAMCGGALADSYARFKDDVGFKNTHVRELGIYRLRDPQLERVMPHLYGIYEDASREAYVVVMEMLDKQVILRDTADRPDLWKPNYIEAALRDIGRVHGAFLGRESELEAHPWFGPVMTAEKMVQMRPLWRALAENAALEYGDWIGDEDLQTVHETVATISEWWGEIERMDRTLVHNDFNLRNIAMRIDAADPLGVRLVAYDWELATLHLPQRDAAEFLAFVLPDDVDSETLSRYISIHRESVAATTGREIDPDEWTHGFALALRDFVITRLSLYMMGHTFRDYTFLDRVVHTTRRTARLLRIGLSLSESAGRAT